LWDTFGVILSRRSIASWLFAALMAIAALGSAPAASFAIPHLRCAIVWTDAHPAKREIAERPKVRGAYERVAVVFPKEDFRPVVAAHDARLFQRPPPVLSA
jgi:hypothetical protein